MSTTPTTLRLPRTSRAIPTRTRTATRRVPTVLPLVLALLLAAGAVVGAQATGFWSTSGRQVSATGTSTAEEKDTSTAPTAIEDVKGWMTLDQVVRGGFPGVTEASLRARFEIPADVPLSTALKDLAESVPGFEVTALREWLADPTA